MCCILYKTNICSILDQQFQLLLSGLGRVISKELQGQKTLLELPLGFVTDELMARLGLIGEYD